MRWPDLFVRAVLVTIGGFLVVFGAWRLLDPVGFFAFSGLVLGNDPGLLSEARGAGALVLAFGGLILAGSVFSSLTRTSAATAWILLWSFGLGRIVGLINDGLPSAQVLQGLFSELLFGAVSAVALLVHLRQRRASKLSDVSRE